MPRGVAERGEGFPCLEGPSGARIRGVRPAFPLPNQPGKSAWLSGQVLCPQRPPLGHVGPGGIGGRPGENRRGRQEGPSRTGGVGEERRLLALPTQAREACWAPTPCPPPLLGRIGPGGIGGGQGENRRGRREGLSRTRGAGEEQRALVPPTRARETC